MDDIEKFKIKKLVKYLNSAKGSGTSVITIYIPPGEQISKIQNMLLTELKPWRILLVFLFGLIHGLGFASSLNEIGLPRNQFALSILSFNVGVELGQISIILAVFGLLVIPFGKKPYFKKCIVYPISIAIAAMALYWTIERVFFL